MGRVPFWYVLLGIALSAWACTPCPDGTRPEDGDCVEPRDTDTDTETDTDTDTETDTDPETDTDTDTPKPDFWTEHILPPEVVDGGRRVYFVSSSEGDDQSGDGSQGNPYRTINRAYLAVRQVAGAYTGPYNYTKQAARGEIGGAGRGVPALHAAILLKRGDIFEADEERAFLSSQGLGGFSNTASGSVMVALEVQGVSPDERFLFSSYGTSGPDDYSGPRPVIHLSRNEVAASGTWGGEATCACRVWIRCGGLRFRDICLRLVPRARL